MVIASRTAAAVKPPLERQNTDFVKKKREGKIWGNIRNAMRSLIDSVFIECSFAATSPPAEVDAPLILTHNSCKSEIFRLVVSVSGVIYVRKTCIQDHDN